MEDAGLRHVQYGTVLKRGKKAAAQDLFIELHSLDM